MSDDYFLRIISSLSGDISAFSLEPARFEMCMETNEIILKIYDSSFSGKEVRIYYGRHG